MKKSVAGSADVFINVPVEKVWEALTLPEIIKQYFFGTDTETEWNVGGPIKFSGSYNGVTYEDKGTILAFEPSRKLSYSYWSSMSVLEDKAENYMIVTFELSPENKGTRLEVKQENIRDEKTRDHSVENWKKVLAGLKILLEKDSEISAY